MPKGVYSPANKVKIRFSRVQGSKYYLLGNTSAYPAGSFLSPKEREEDDQLPLVVVRVDYDNSSGAIPTP